MKCPGCGTEIPSGKNSCPMCGATMEKIRADLGDKFLEAKPVISEPSPSATPTQQQTSQTTKTIHKTCKYCSMSVPASAVVCPYCRKKIGMTVASKVIAGLFILLVSTCVLQTGNKTSAPPAPPPTPEEIARKKEAAEHDEAQYHAKSFIERSLKAPATAKFPSFDEFPAVKKDGYWEVFTYVDAQNSFGALIRTRFHVKMKNLGDQWQLVDISSY